MYTNAHANTSTAAAAAGTADATFSLFSPSRRNALASGFFFSFFYRNHWRRHTRTPFINDDIYNIKLNVLIIFHLLNIITCPVYSLRRRLFLMWLYVRTVAAVVSISLGCTVRLHYSQKPLEKKLSSSLVFYRSLLYKYTGCCCCCCLGTLEKKKKKKCDKFHRNPRRPISSP